MTGSPRLLGGIGQEPLARSGDDPTPLWATRVTTEHPGLLRDIHGDDFAAGSGVATTNARAIHHDRLEPCGLGPIFPALHLGTLAGALRAAARQIA